MPSDAAETDRPRVPSLDGLRGYAALTVLVGHAVLAGTAWSLPHEPTWLGLATIAVLVFFVLSGFVLSRPLLAGRPFNAAAYYPARLLRLYLPVWGALAFAALLHALFWDTYPGIGWFVAAHLEPITLSGFGNDAALALHDPNWQYIGALWTLRWEVLFSLLLPLYVLVARVSGRWVWVPVLVCLGLIAWRERQEMDYLPVFFLGTALAAVETPLRERWARWSPGGHGLVAGAAAASVVLGLWGPRWFDLSAQLAALASALGALLIVVTALLLAPLGAFLTRPVSGWLGSRSFSLYLVHEPILITLAFVTRGSMGSIAFVVAACVLALAGAEGFYRAIEHPAHRLSRRIGRAIRTRQAAGRPTRAPA